MTQLFEMILQTTAGASILVVVVLLLMLALGNRYNQKWRYWVWMFIAIRLVLPFDIPHDASLFTFSIPEEKTVITYNPDNNVGTQTTPDKIIIPSDIPQNIVQNPTQDKQPVIPPTTVTTPTVNDNIIIPIMPSEDVVDVTPVKTVSLTQIFAVIWLAGVLGCAIWHIVMHVRFLGRAKLWNRPVTEPWANEIFNNVKKEMGIAEDVKLYRNRSVHSPILTGFFKPTVLIPTRNLTENDLYMVLRHELLHYKRHDLWYKLLLVVAGCLHWFNPIVWFMVKRADRDLEIACDEAVVKGESTEFRKDYCETILRIIRCDRGRKPALSTGFTTGKKTMKKRFACALDSTAKRTGVALLCVVLCATIVCSTFIACDITKNLTPQEIFDSITQEDIDDAIENPDEFAKEELEYYESILDPYEYPIGVSGELSWSNVSELSVAKLLRFYEMSSSGFAAFYDRVQVGAVEDVKVVDNLMYVPAEEVEGFISKRFNIVTESFRTQAGLLDLYESMQNAYPFKIERGFGGFYDYKLLKVEKTDNIWKLYCSNSYPVYYGNEEAFEEDYAVIVIEHNGEDNYKYLCAKGFHEDKFASIRAKFEYPFSEGIRLCEEGNFAFDETISQENRNVELASLIYYSARAGKSGYNDTYFLGDQDMASAAISMLRDTVYSSEYSEYWGSLEDQLVILNHISEGEFIPQEWVEKAIQQIWGNDVTINHYDSFDWVYNKDVGVYAPRGMMTNYIYPYIHSVTKTEKGYVAEVSYIYSNGDIWGDVGGYENAIGTDDYKNIFADPDVVALAKKQAVYSVTAEYSSDGNLYLVSCVIKGKEEYTLENIRQILQNAQNAYQNKGTALEVTQKNPDVVVSTAAFLGVENSLGFEAFAVEEGKYELLNTARLRQFIQNCKSGVADTVVTIKSGEPLPLYAVVLRYDGVSIKKDSYYLRDDELVNITSSQLVEVSESETMWFFSCDGEVATIYPKGKLQPLPFAEAGSVTTDEIAKKLESVNKYGFKVKYHGEDVVLETDVHRFDYYDQGNLMDYIYVSKDLQKIFVVEHVNGHVLTVVK